jgi:uncharacterized protein YbaA (DUF1428 family)
MNAMSLPTGIWPSGADRAGPRLRSARLMVETQWPRIAECVADTTGAEMKYVDGYVVAVPAGNKDAYREQAAQVATVFKKNGALRMVECWGDEVPKGKVTDFQGAVKAKDDEVVVFSWIEWPSKEVRDAGMKKVMEDPFMQQDRSDLPFDGQRMIFGGFAAIVDQ